jgi:predicted esterase
MDPPHRFDMIELVVPKNPPMPKHEAEEDMHASVKRVHELIEDEIAKGIDPDRIVISGFSQGESCGDPVLVCPRLEDPEN